MYHSDWHHSNLQGAQSQAAIGTRRRLNTIFKLAESLVALAP